MPCRKTGYLTKHEAKQAKRACQKAHADGATWRTEKRLYRCGCGLWHLTSDEHFDYPEELDA